MAHSDRPAASPSGAGPLRRFRGPPGGPETNPGFATRGVLSALPSPYSSPMNTIHLTDTELEMAKHALQAYLQAFGHDEADTVGEIRRVIAKLRATQAENDQSSIPA